ncbi:uncharacterized protein [Mytilus edulis]
MATSSFCDLCSEENKSSLATNFCSDCAERLCTDCTKSHDRFKAFKAHHVIDISTIASYIPLSAKKICTVHPDMLTDYYCTAHEIVCCRACIPKGHRKCENVLLLEHASKDVKKSALFTDVMLQINHLVTTLNDLHDNRESNLQSLLKTKSVITKQISTVKSRLLKQIDDVERDLHAELSSLHRKHEMEICKQKEEISQVLNNVKENDIEIEFLKNHGSNNQLFISLHQQVTNIKIAEASVLQMISYSQEIEITYDEKKDVKLECFGSLSESVSSCQVQYKTKKFQQAQIMTQPTKQIAGFEMGAELQSRKWYPYCLKDICVTGDNKLLLTNYSGIHPKLYVYRDCTDYETEFTFSCYPLCVAVIPGTDKAAVTLPNDKSIQFINTKKMIKGDTVNVGFTCHGITAGHDRIYVGGESGTIKTLDTNGNILNTIHQGSGVIDRMSYDDSGEQINVGCLNELICINLDGTHVYSKDISGTSRIARDEQGNIYYCGHCESTIWRMSSDWKNNEEMLNKDNHGIRSPYGMCFNNEFTKLFVINKNSKSVFVYNCKY